MKRGREGGGGRVVPPTWLVCTTPLFSCTAALRPCYTILCAEYVADRVYIGKIESCRHLRNVHVWGPYNTTRCTSRPTACSTRRNLTIHFRQGSVGTHIRRSGQYIRHYYKKFIKVSLCQKLQKSDDIRLSYCKNNKKLSYLREAARCFVFVCSQLQHTYSAVILLLVTAASDLLVHKIAVFTYRSPHFCFPWRRPCDYHAICCMNGKTIQCLPNPSQHVPIYL